MQAEVGEKNLNFTLPFDSWDGKIPPQDVTVEGPLPLYYFPGDGPDLEAVLSRLDGAL